MHSMSVFDPGFETNFDFPSKTPMFSTIIQKPVSGRGEIRASLQPYPLWKIEYEMNFARGDESQAAANSVYQYVLGFFMNMGGQFSDFLYEDPNDNSVAQMPLFIGEGVTRNIQLTRQIGIGTDIVQNLNGTPTIFTTGYEFGPGGPLGTENFFSWSERQDMSAKWAVNQLTVSGPVAAPDGNTTAYLLTPTGGATACQIDQVTTPPFVVDGGQYTMSVWLKAATGTPTVTLYLLNQANVIRATQPITLTTSWDRYTITGTMFPGDIQIIGQMGGGGSWVSATGAISVAWFQLEPGPSATAYLGTGTDPYQYTISSTGIVQYSAPPAPSQVVTWTGKFFYRVRFGDDETTFDQQFDQIWNAGKIVLQSVIL